jgi:hypothetical protein
MTQSEMHPELEYAHEIVNAGLYRVEENNTVFEEVEKTL